MMKKILYISGTRADYGLMRTILKEINDSSDFNLEILACGMHLMPKFGKTASDIISDGLTIHEIPVVFEDDSRKSMAVFIGELIVSISIKISEIQPDVIILLGDRGEMLAGAIAGLYLGIPVAHIHGGEVTSTVDEPVRHAITKLAHIHLPATQKSAERIILMGENPASVFVIGAPGLEQIMTGAFTPREVLIKKYHLESSVPVVLVVQHPVSAEIQDSASQIRATLDAVAELGYQTIVVYPNADAGNTPMINVIDEFTRVPSIQAFRNIPHDDYLGLLKIAAVLVGNSSSGIIEAPSFHLPVINIGSRQDGREHADNIIDTGYDKDQIMDAIKRVFEDNTFIQRVQQCINPYGDGSASQKVLEILREVDGATLVKNKRNYY